MTSVYVCVYLNTYIKLLCKYNMEANDSILEKSFVFLCTCVFSQEEWLYSISSVEVITCATVFVYLTALQEHKSTYMWYPAEVSSVYEDVWGIRQKLWPCNGLGQHMVPKVNPFQKRGSEHPGQSQCVRTCVICELENVRSCIMIVIIMKFGNSFHRTYRTVQKF